MHPGSEQYSVYLEEKTGGRFELETLVQRRNAVNAMQSIVDEERGHEGFYLEYRDEGSDISVSAFRTRHDLDINNRPVLIISYFIFGEPPI